MKYYPILLSKAGELIALSNLSQITKAQISPILQVVEDNFSAVTKVLNSDWIFPNNQLLMDLSLIEDLSSKQVAIESFLRNLVNAGTNLILVFDSNSPKSYLIFVKLLTNQLGLKVCFRQSVNGSSVANYSANVSRILTFFSKPPAEILLLVDIGYVQSGNISIAAANVTGLIQSLPNASSYYRIIVASGSFPENLSPLSANQLHLLKRHEWDMWLQLQSNSLPLNLRYSDYGTKHPIYTSVNFTGTCSIKYSTKSHFAIYRGELSGSHALGNGQYINFAKQLVQSPHYSGSTFC